MGWSLSSNEYYNKRSTRQHYYECAHRHSAHSLLAIIHFLVLPAHSVVSPLLRFTAYLLITCHLFLTEFNTLEPKLPAILRHSILASPHAPIINHLGLAGLWLFQIAALDCVSVSTILASITAVLNLLSCFQLFITYFNFFPLLFSLI